MKNFLHLQNVSKVYGNETILNNVSLSVKRGELVVLLGPSGCGKSTLLNCITGIIPLEKGNIFINGKNITTTNPAHRNLAMVFQSYALYPNMSARKNISFGMEIRKIPKTTIEKKINDVATLLKIEDHLHKRPAQLSGGQRQRVAIARALVREPDIFLFDEPLSNLDAKLRLSTRTELKKLHQRLKATIIYVTHDQIEALTLADKIAIMLGGNIIQFATPATIYNQPINTFVAKFIGTPIINIFPATLQPHKNTWHLALTPGTHNNQAPTSIPPSHLPLPPHLTKLHQTLKDIYDHQQGRVLLGLRSEAITYQIQRTTATTAVPLTGKVEVLVPVGSDTFILCNVAGHEVTARSHAQVDLKVNQKITLQADMHQAILFNGTTEERIR